MANHLGCLADGLAAGRAGGQAIKIRPLQVEIVREMGRGRVRLLFKLPVAVETAQSTAREQRRIDGTLLRPVALGHQADQIVKVLDAFAAAEVDAATRPVDLVVVKQVGVGQGLLRRRHGKAAVSAGIDKALGILDVAAQVEILHLGGEPGRELAGVEQLDGADAALSFNLGTKQLLDTVSQRRDGAHSGYDNSPSHYQYPITTS